MAQLTPTQRITNAAELLELIERFGGIAPERVRLDPPPGTATESDLIRLNEQREHLYELVDGTLVEKVVGLDESLLAMRIGRLLGNFAEEHDLGEVAGADATLRLLPGLVRLPDVSFLSSDRLSKRDVPAKPIASLAPDLAIEVLSKGNTTSEMERKLKEYFISGSRLVWFVDLKKRTVEVFTAPDRSVVFTEEQVLDGGDVLPGLALPVRVVFAKLRRPEPKKPKTPRKPKKGDTSS